MTAIEAIVAVLSKHTSDAAIAATISRIALSRTLEQAPHELSAQELAQQTLALTQGETVDTLQARNLHTLSRVGAALSTMHGVSVERAVAAQTYLVLKRDTDEQQQYARSYLEHCLASNHDVQAVQATLDSLAGCMTDSNRRDVLGEVASYIRDAFGH
jgi:hypothetical protein